jgi:hypothetical protein
MLLALATFFLAPDCESFNRVAQFLARGAPLEVSLALAIFAPAELES